jgi:hypothetical protein
MALEQVLGFNLNGEGVASLLNIKALSLAQAATEVEQAVRLGEMNAAINAVQTQIDNINSNHTRISEVHVDSVSGTLAEALALGTYDSGAHTWTFADSTVIGEGDVIILQAATNPKDRTWIHAGGTAGTEADFEHLNSDIEALVDAGVTSVLAALRDNVPEAGDTLAKLYTLIQSLDSQITQVVSDLAALDNTVDALASDVAGKADVFQETITFAPSGTAGIYEATVANPSANPGALIALKQEVSTGVMNTVSPTAYTDLVSAANITIRTMSPSMNGQTYALVIEG